MPQSLARVAIHLVYSTKNRTPWLNDKSLWPDLGAYNATILQNDVDSPAIQIGGVEDHVHILCWLSRKHAIMEVVQRSKTETAKWIKKQRRDLSNFQWQAGYGAFSVSISNIEEVKHYIRNQEKHHSRMSYQDETSFDCCARNMALKLMNNTSGTDEGAPLGLPD